MGDATAAPARLGVRDRGRNRRVIHLEYAVETLPGGLEWFGSVVETRLTQTVS